MALPTYQSEQFAQPVAECDIIMKGGVTSGVVYPLAVCELALHYRLRSIGGTSAGAIAASLAAAAEHGRNGPGGGFVRLAGLPDFLQRNLLGLLQPARATRPAFEVLLAWSGRAGVARKVVASLGKLARFHPLALLLGAAGGLGLFHLLFHLAAPVPAGSPGVSGLTHGALGAPGGIAVAALFALSWGVAAAAAAFLAGAVRGIRANLYGMCSGLGADPDGPPALIPWLERTLREIAGKEGGPLTFGDLWGSVGPDAAPAERRIDLEVMTTNLTLGAPERLPWSTREMYFDPAEMRRLFPAAVVEWMAAHPPAPPESERPEDAAMRQGIAAAGKLPFPPPESLPVVVAVRMSLSFPLLFSAVPLYAVDWTLEANQRARREGRAPELGRCWYSDGGIGTNFPVQFFDQLLPGRPTFGINLRPFHPDHPEDPVDESKNVWFPTAARQGVRPVWSEIGGLPSFVVRIIDTMQNWVDTTQMRLPSYRDRVIHIHLTAAEGGMNLDMPAALIEKLARRGQAAGRMLVEQFRWDDHRWTRYLVTMSQLQEHLDTMAEVYDEGFAGFLAAHDAARPPYAQRAGWKPFSDGAMRGLMELVKGWRASRHSFGEAPPHPEPELRIQPRR